MSVRQPLLRIATIRSYLIEANEDAIPIRYPHRLGGTSREGGSGRSSCEGVQGVLRPAHGPVGSATAVNRGSSSRSPRRLLDGLDRNVPLGTAAHFANPERRLRV